MHKDGCTEISGDVVKLDAEIQQVQDEARPIVGLGRKPDINAEDEYEMIEDDAPATSVVVSSPTTSRGIAREALGSVFDPPQSDEGSVRLSPHFVKADLFLEVTSGLTGRTCRTMLLSARIMMPMSPRYLPPKCQLFPKRQLGKRSWTRSHRHGGVEWE